MVRRAIRSASASRRHAVGRRIRLVDAARAATAVERSGATRRRASRSLYGPLRDRDRPARCRTSCARGEASVDAPFAYSVHVEVTGLAPGRPYWYRFTCGDAQSRIGKASTLPASDADDDEADARASFRARTTNTATSARTDISRTNRPTSPSFSATTSTSTSRRAPRKFARTAMASKRPRCRCIATVMRNIGRIPICSDCTPRCRASSRGTTTRCRTTTPTSGRRRSTIPAVFLQRRAAAYQAFYEHMPVRPSRSLPHGRRHARARPLPVRRTRRDLAARRPSVSQSRSVLRTARSRRQPQRIRRELSGVARTLAIVARRRTGEVALRRARAIAHALESDRARRVDGAAARTHDATATSSTGSTTGTATLPRDNG